MLNNTYSRDVPGSKLITQQRSKEAEEYNVVLFVFGDVYDFERAFYEIQVAMFRQLSAEPYHVCTMHVSSNKTFMEKAFEEGT